MNKAEFKNEAQHLPTLSDPQVQTNVYMLVGEDYDSFANEHFVFTPSQFEFMVDKGLTIEGASFILSQGLDISAMQEIKNRLEVLGAASVNSPAPRASLELTHKEKLGNVLVSRPESIGKSSYGFDLIVDGAKDRLSDHVTGQHLGGMLLVEAARQASIAGIECHYARPNGKRWGLAMQGMKCRFDNYAFPVPTRIRVDLNAVSQSESTVVLAIHVEFMQASRNVSCIDFEVTLYPKNVLERMEASMAAKAAKEARSHGLPRTEIRADNLCV